MESPAQVVPRLVAAANSYATDAKARLQQELIALLQQISSLHLSIAPLVHDNGTTSSLLQLSGTIPIYYRGNQYNIPVSIWLLESYPQVPPKCYVTPTQDMRIKERHRHVDQSGLVYLPYLHHWRSSSSNLDELVSYMSSVFSDDPPVYRYDPPVSRVEPPRALEVPKPQPVSPAFPPAAAAAAVLVSPRVQPVALVSPAVAQQAQQAQLLAARKEKLVAEVTAKLQTAYALFNKEFTRELDDLFEKQLWLTQSAAKINDVKTALKKEQESLTIAVSAAVSRVQELEKWLAENEKAAELDVDTVVVPEDALSRQMFDAVAGDLAIEDALYALDRAIQDERIDLQTFLKQVRKLSRAQFFHRALALKIVSRQAALHSHQQSAMPAAQPPPQLPPRVPQFI